MRNKFYLAAILALATFVVSVAEKKAEAQVRPVRGRAAEMAREKEADEEKSIRAEGDTIKIAFPEMQLEDVLKNFSEITQKSFILDQLPKGQVQTIGPIGPVEIPKDQAYNLFVLIMGLNGYDVVSTSIPGVYKVVRKAEIMTSLPKDRIYPPGARPEISESMVMRFIPIEHVNAQDIVNQVSQLASKDGGQVIAYPATNNLIILDTAANIDRMLKVIRLLDVPSEEPEVEIVQLRHATPQEVSGVLSQIFQSSDSGSPARTATTKTAPTTRRSRRDRDPAPAQAATSVVNTTSAGGDVKIIPVERTNSLVIIGNRDVIESVKEFIAKLDVDVGTTGTIHVYYLQNAEASELSSTLQGLAGGSRRTTTAATSSTRSTRSMRADGESEAAQALASRRTSSSRTTPTSSGSSGGTISGILSSDITITSDEPTNALIIVATPQDYEILKRVIEKLDVPRRQVFVEAVLLEVTYNESNAGGVSMHGGSPVGGESFMIAGTGFSDVSSLSVLGQLSSSGGSVALPSGITMGALASPVEIPGYDGVYVPSAGVVVRALSTNSNVNVLSTPTLLTTDNEEATIEVGQKIPVPTGQTVSTGGFSNVSISRESVGIKLRLTPQINDGDNIAMEISTEISGAVQSGLGIDVNTLGVTTSIKSAETKVIVKDSQTIVIGGLMEDREDESESRVPFLGDIPVLGWLFKSASQSKSKTNLIILVTPHIVRSESDAMRVKDHIEEGYKGIVEDELGDDERDWDKYFRSQMIPDAKVEVLEPAPSPAPAPRNEGSSLDWNWTPADVETEDDSQVMRYRSQPSRSATTRETDESAKPE